MPLRHGTIRLSNDLTDMTDLNLVPQPRDERSWRPWPGRRPLVGWKAPLDAQAPVLGRIGSLETRLARSKAEFRAVQALRYEVFYRELSARPGAVARLLKRDKDEWDEDRKSVV